MPQIIWGPGLTTVLHTLPPLIATTVLASSLPTVFARLLPSSTPTQAFLDLPAPLRGVLSYLAFILTRRAVRNYLRYKDMKRFGPDVVEAPRLKMHWLWNLELIPFSLRSRRIDYCLGMWSGLLNEYGNTFNMRLLEEDQIWTIEPEHIKAILSTEFSSFEKGADLRAKMFSVLGKGVFNSDGEMWKFHRSMSRPFFTRDRISDFDLFARHSDAAITKLLARLSESSQSAIDFQDIAGRFTLDSGAEFLFGRDVHSLAALLPYPHARSTDDSASFAAAFGKAQELVLIRFGLEHFWSFFEMFSDRTGASMQVIDAYVRPILREKLDQRRRLGNMKKGDEGEGSLEDESKTLLDHLVQLTDDETLIKDEIINILVAGRDTTAATLTFATYLLATHPNVMAKLRDEILAHVGPVNYPSSDDFREMKYLRAVINETLRLFPAVPLNQRTAVRSTVFRSGGKAIYVPKGAKATYSVLHMHRRKDLWGPDADEFDPERWIDERLGKYVTPNPFIFLPFNAGPRICLGQQFAYNETSFFLVRLLQRVESISLAPEAHPEGTLPPPEWKNGTGRKVYEKVWPKSHLTIFSNGGMWVRMKEVSGATE